MVKTEEIKRFEENPGKIWKLYEIPEERLSYQWYHIWEVNHRICEETWLKTLKSEEDLRSVLKKSKGTNNTNKKKKINFGAPLTK